MSKDQLVTVTMTDDGSPTLFSSAFDAHYHSTHGALQESLHVFIKHGLEFCISNGKTDLSILEFGFGSGLNALLTLKAASKLSLKIDYHGIEGYPVDLEQINAFANNISDKETLKALHQTMWETSVPMTPNFKLYKEKSLFEDFRTVRQFDLIYYDAFAPSCQPDLWDLPILKKAYDALNTHGILVTFCAKGSFKRNLKCLGFEVERLPGPPGKREMTRARKL